MEYRIVQGDTLSALAGRYNTTVEAIVDANRDTITNPDLIFEGASITMPAGAAQARTGAQTACGTHAQPTLPTSSRPVSLGAAATPQRPTAPPPPAATAPTSAAAREDHEFERRVLDLVNQERSTRGLRPLAYDARLDRAAEGHTAHQGRVGKMAHDGIGNGTIESRVRAAGWSSGYSENVAYGQMTPEEVMTTWMNSPPHRAGILDPRFTHIGVAFEKSATNGLNYWTQNFGIAP